MKFVMLLFIC